MGIIKLLPDDPKLDLDQGEIEDGKFSFSAQSGKKKVQIFAYHIEKGVPPDPPTTIYEINYIPPNYNAQSTLTADVTRDGPNELKFELKSETE